eukprot:jgi/Mesvir1/2188/Mv16693-RA.1
MSTGLLVAASQACISRTFQAVLERNIINPSSSRPTRLCQASRHLTWAAPGAKKAHLVYYSRSTVTTVSVMGANRGRIEPGPGQESVWDYPRPAIAQPTTKHLQVIFNNKTIMDTKRGFRVLETSHPPTYYFPREDVDMSCFEEVPGVGSICEWKGGAVYFNIVVDGKRLERIAWSYPNPTESFKGMAGYIAVYPWAMDACLVDGEKATPQEGRFYGGWITKDVVGPFKGGAGTWGW